VGRISLFFFLSHLHPGRKKMYIGNLRFDVAIDDIKDFFGQYGDLHDVFIPLKDGEPRGFAFVTMDAENADTAISQTNGVEFMGRPLVVSESMDKNEKSQKKRQRQRTY
jgi:cold-inducible RNA-binding protein